MNTFPSQNSFIERLINWLMARPIVNVLIALAYYLLVVLPHEQVGIFIAETFKINERAKYNLIFLSLGLILLLLLAIPIIRGIRTHGNSRKVIFYLSATIIFTILSFKFLLVLNSEVIHFPQYAVMAFLLFPLCKNYKEVLFWIIILGAVDEAYQYFYLAPERTDYFDFNDVIIDTLGGAFGLILLRSQNILTLTKTRHWLRSPITWTCIGLSSILLLLWLTGILYIYPPEKGIEASFLLVKKIPEGFWSIIPPKITFHIVQPLEGIILILLLWIFYIPLGKR